jgi:hypothetical protein
VTVHDGQAGAGYSVVGSAGPVVAAGFIAGAGWRVLSAGVAGANIGAGFVVLLGGPMVLVLLVWAMGFAVYLLSRTDHASEPPINPDSK